MTVVNVILVINVAVYLLWLYDWVPLEAMVSNFTVSWEHLAAGHVWVLVTSVFSHNLLLHLVVNMIVLMSFGPLLERIMGSGRFLAFYLAAGIIGSLAHALTSMLLIGNPGQPALGASSAIAGMLLLTALVFPRARILLLFVIPLPAIVAALAFVAIDIWGLVAQMEGGGLPIGHGAHLGGAFVGLLYFILRGRELRQQAGRS